MRNAIALLLAGLLSAGIARAEVSAEPAAEPPAAPVVKSADAPRLTADQSIPPAELEGFVDGVVTKAMAEDHIMGITVSVVQDGQVVLKKGYGFASLDQQRGVDPDKTLFRIGSITKTFNWIMLMKAVEAGRIDLDETANSYLPADLRIPDQGFKQQIRMRDLITHSPGFEDRALGVLFANDPAKVLTLSQFLHDHRPARVREPGLYSSYSNYGAALAGAVVASVEGGDWQSLVERDILNPLGMNHTTPREPYPSREGLPAPMTEALVPDISEAFRWNGTSFKARKYEYITQIAPAGAMSSTAGDMARYMLMQLGDGTLDGVTIYDTELAKAFRTPMTKFPAEVGNLDAGFIDTLVPGGYHSYWHNGGTLSFFSNMVLVPDLRLGVFISTNTEGGAKLSGSLPSLIISNYYAKPKSYSSEGDKDIATKAAPYVGAYLPMRRAASGLEGFVMHAVQSVQAGVSPDGYLVIQNARLLPTDQEGLFRNPETGGGVLFEKSADGRVRIVGPAGSAEKAGFFETPTTLLMITVLALIAAIATIIGAFVRIGRGLSTTLAQAFGGHLQLAACVLFLVSLGALGMTAAGASDTEALFYSWPGTPVLTFSAVMLACALLTLVTVGLLPGVWRTGSGVVGWSTWRKLRFSLTGLIFFVLGVMLAFWGALEPWRS